MSPSATEKKTLTASMFLTALVLCVSFVSYGECQTTPPPAIPCSTYKNCDTCVPHARCLWCFSTNNCTEYPVTWVLPPAAVCQLSQARWGVCWLNFEALIISMAVVGGAILLGIAVCCCCCCCCKSRSRSSGPDRDEERFARRREEIKQRAEERKAERKERHDEIRRKYGLIGDSDHPYSKFDNE